MICFVEKTTTLIAENLSAIFLYPRFTPTSAPEAEQISFSMLNDAVFSGDTPAGEVSCVAESMAYQVSSEYVDCNLDLSCSLADEVADIAPIVSETADPEDVISVAGDLSEGSSSVFRFKEHVSPGFYVTVYGSCCTLRKTDDDRVGCAVYCSSALGFVPAGMELKIAIQSLKL